MCRGLFDHLAYGPDGMPWHDMARRSAARHAKGRKKIVEQYEKERKEKRTVKEKKEGREKSRKGRKLPSECERRIGKQTKHGKKN